MSCLLAVARSRRVVGAFLYVHRISSALERSEQPCSQSFDLCEHTNAGLMVSFGRIRDGKFGNATSGVALILRRISRLRKHRSVSDWRRRPLLQSGDWVFRCGWGVEHSVLTLIWVLGLIEALGQRCFDQRLSWKRLFCQSLDITVLAISLCSASPWLIPGPSIWMLAPSRRKRLSCATEGDGLD